MFVTRVSSVRPGFTSIRGQSHFDLIQNTPYADAAFLTLVGRIPTQSESRLFQAMAVSVIDHGFVSVTTTTGRYAASGNPQIVPAVAAGMLAAGDNTLSPGLSYDMLTSVSAAVGSGMSARDAAEVYVQGALSHGARIPGLGHPIHREVDYRAEALFQLASTEGVSGVHVELIHEIRNALHRATGKKHIPINVDGCIASLAADLSLTRSQAVGIALIGVIPGLIAHVAEQIESGSPLEFADGIYASEPGRPE